MRAVAEPCWYRYNGPKLLHTCKHLKRATLPPCHVSHTHRFVRPPCIPKRLPYNPMCLPYTPQARCWR